MKITGWHGVSSYGEGHPGNVHRGATALRCSGVELKDEAMNHNVGVWIDHKKAVIVSASTDRVTARTVESGIGPHARFSGRAGYPTPDGPRSGGGERQYEERYGQHLDRYYDEIISQLGQPEAVLIFGPGEAKLQLKERLSRSNGMSERSVEIETTDKLTDPQIVAKVKEHYGIDR